jgi:SAM-dependent methyltransferase
MENENLKKCQEDYTHLPFEDVLRTYRQQNIFRILEGCTHKKILEIGSGPLPLFHDFNDFEKMVVVEPGDTFFEVAKSFAGSDTRIELINDFFENIVDQLAPEKFDFIVIGGFLHEIPNPGEVLQAVKKVCHQHTIVHSFVPNANSFHRLLAFEMGIIKDVYEKSGHDQLFQRQMVYNMDTFQQLFLQNSLKIATSGSYFFKPFTNSQMAAIVSTGIITNAVLDGLDKMIRYFPEYGSEIFINAFGI